MVNKPEQNPSDPSANDDDEAVWLDLVARLEATTSGLPETGQRKAFTDFDPLGVSRPADAGSKPSVAPEPGPTDGRGGPAVEPGMHPRPHSEDRQGRHDSGGPRDYDSDDADGDFIPGEPPSLANVEPAIMLAWIGALGAPVGLLLTAMLWRDAPLTAIFGMVAVFLICAGYLIFRLPASRGEDDDDGAVV
ncbi:MAG TPA: hypothetical protein VIG41_11975 [Micrococcaceae bacterium]